MFVLPFSASFVPAGASFTAIRPAGHTAGMPPLLCMPLPLTPALEESAVELCAHWIAGHVIRLGLCPYAAKPFTEEKIRYVVSPAVDDESLIEDFFVEGQILLDADAEELATTMLIAPQYNGDIEDFFSLYEWLVDTLESETHEMPRQPPHPFKFCSLVRNLHQCKALRCGVNLG